MVNFLAGSYHGPLKKSKVKSLRLAQQVVSAGCYIFWV